MWGQESESDSRDRSLFLRKPSHFLGAAQQAKTNQRKHDRAPSKEQRNTSPRSETSILFSVRPNAVHAEIADDAEASVGRLEEQGSRAVFLCSVP